MIRRQGWGSESVLLTVVSTPKWPRACGIATKTRRSGAVCCTSARNERRFSCTSGRSCSPACKLFFLRVRSRWRKARHRVFRLQLKPPRRLSCSKGGAGCSRISAAGRRWSSGPKAGGGPPPLRLGSESAGVAAVLEQADDERETDAGPPGDLAQGVFVEVHGGRDPLTKVGRIGAHGNHLLHPGWLALDRSPRCHPYRMQACIARF